jgi:hypothetical protein
MTSAILTSISVTPLNPLITVGANLQMKATGNYSDGTSYDITPLVVWTSSNTGVATVSTTGLATGVAPGITTIKAAVGVVSGITTLTVTSGWSWNPGSRILPLKVFRRKEKRRWCSEVDEGRSSDPGENRWRFGSQIVAAEESGGKEESWRKRGACRGGAKSRPELRKVDPGYFANRISLIPSFRLERKEGIMAFQAFPCGLTKRR